MLDLVLFYLFSAMAVFSCSLVIFSGNAVHSVLYLILAFFNVAGLFVLIGAEFFAMLLMVVYVGAVAVLFLFVMMMLDVDYTKLKSGVTQHLPIIAVIAGLFGAETAFAVAGYFTLDATGAGLLQDRLFSTISIHDLGRVLYTDYIFYFQACGFILLVAMIGAISLTMRSRENVRRQKISGQVLRDSKEAVHLVDIKPSASI